MTSVEDVRKHVDVQFGPHPLLENMRRARRFTSRGGY